MTMLQQAAGLGLGLGLTAIGAGVAGVFSGFGAHQMSYNPGSGSMLFIAPATVVGGAIGVAGVMLSAASFSNPAARGAAMLVAGGVLVGGSLAAHHAAKGHEERSLAEFRATGGMR